MIAIADESILQVRTQSSQLHQATPKRPTRTVTRRKTLLNLISERLTNAKIREYRDIYFQGRECIADLSQRVNCPPVLLYCSLTPLWSKTALKVRLLREEISILDLRDKGYSDSKIAETLNLPKATVKEHSDGRYSEETYIFRSWYTDRAPKPKDPNDIEYDESTLPPTSRLGWVDGALTDIPANRKGRCPDCGYIVSIPCHACRVRRDMSTKNINRAVEYVFDGEEEEVQETDLLFV